jgi:hypothetical protein
MHHPKLKDSLRPDLLAEYEQFLRDTPSSTLDSSVQWLAGRGVRLSRKAVWTHRKTFHSGGQFPRTVAELARSIQDAGVRCRMVIMPHSETVEVEFLPTRLASKPAARDKASGGHAKAD